MSRIADNVENSRFNEIFEAEELSFAGFDIGAVIAAAGGVFLGSGVSGAHVTAIAAMFSAAGFDGAVGFAFDGLGDMRRGGIDGVDAGDCGSAAGFAV